MAVAASLAYSFENKFHLFWFLLSAAGVYLIEIGKNAVNEIVDYISGVDTFIPKDERTPFSGGKKTIVDGLLTVKDVRNIAIYTFLAAVAVGLIVWYFREPKIFYIGLSGMALSIFYSLPPFMLCYRGLGELAVGIAFGPLVLCGMYLVLASSIRYEAIIASVILGFLIANVLWVNQFPDYEADKKGNKKNWVVRLGKERSVTIFALLFALAYLTDIILVLYTKNLVFLLPLISLPLSVKAVKVAKENLNYIPKFIEANALTVQIYQLTGITLVAASLISKFLMH
ncbi:prenyltransferase [Thermovenabulum sp.]|uniref:prenyltransferase n=1 Tax=Thermovenabulum sp. TaxID=3100335 RepID=UPI003C7A4734